MSPSNALDRPQKDNGNSDWRALLRACWLEFKLAVQYHGATPDTLLGTVECPAGFANEELGFGSGCGPSILFTLNKLARQRANKSRRTKKLTVREWSERLADRIEERALAS